MERRGRRARLILGGLGLAWIVVSLYGSWRAGTDAGMPVWLVVNMVVTGSVVGIVFVAHFVHTFRAPTRRRVDWWDRSWSTLFVIVGSLIGFGLWALIGGDPDASRPAAGVMLVLGLACVWLVVRHLRKPIDPDA